MNFLLYAGKVILCSAVLFGYYHLFLRNKKFHRYNRIFVLAATLFSVLFPLFRIPVFFEGSQDTSAWIIPLQTMSLISWEKAFVVTADGQSSPFLTWQTAAWTVYTAGFIVCSIPVLRSLLYIRKLSGKYKKEEREGIAFYNTHEPGTPFSFFRTIFWSDQIPVESERGRYILQHELFHAGAKHSQDMLSVQFIANLFWFNPFFHLFLKEIQAIHEFLADEWAGSTASKWDYAELLVTQAIRQRKVAVSHPFFHHQIKRRITMIINQPPSHSSYLSRVMTLPLLFALFCAFTMEVSCRNNTSSSFSPETSAPAQSKSVTGILPAQEFMNRVEEHQSLKGTSIKVWNFDTTRDLLTAKFENNEVIMTRLSEVNKLKHVGTGRNAGDNTPIFTKVDIEAGYPGGVQAYTRFLNKSCHYPTEAQDNEIQGTVVVQFIVDKDGNISDVQAISGPERGDLKEEAVRVITASGKWLPAVQNGHLVTSYKKQPIIFRLDAE